MRPLLAALAFATLAFFPALADHKDPRLDRLFAQLAAVRTAPEAAELETQIIEIWTRSGSDTVDVLMERAKLAVTGQDFATAKKLLDSIVELRPTYAQAWFRRAELLAAMDSHEEAAADLEKTLEFEPRHFGALVLAGRIADIAGDKRAAVAAYRRAVLLNPMLEGIARRAGQLNDEVENTVKKPPPT
jgi:tetratricopeptide (TPR) repeat protein